MKRRLVLAVVVAAVLSLSAAPAMAAERHAVTIDATTMFLTDPDAFVATGLPGCEDGLVVDGPGHVNLLPWGGVYAGFKVFTCTGDEGGFTLRLNARFGDWPRTGNATWSVVEAWGTLDGMRGAGKLWGEGITDGVIDHYWGTVVL